MSCQLNLRFRRIRYRFKRLKNSIMGHKIFMNRKRKAERKSNAEDLFKAIINEKIKNQ